MARIYEMNNKMDVNFNADSYWLHTFLSELDVYLDSSVAVVFNLQKMMTLKTVSLLF